MGLMNRYWKLGIVWALSLVAVATITASAQSFLLIESPQIVSGNDIGFRLERTQDGIPVGKMVIRIDGKWVDVASPK
jgi:hypothetical protein